MELPDGFLEEIHFDYWVAALGLSDWTIELTAEPAMEFSGCGSCGINPARRIAFVRIAHPHSGSDDIEETLVHELLHLYFDIDDMDEKGYRSTRMEQGIDHLSKLLVAFRRSE